MTFCRVAGLCIWWFAVAQSVGLRAMLWWRRPLEEAVQGELSFFFNALVGDVRHFLGHGVLSCCGPVYMVVCRSAIGWFEGCAMVVSSFGGGSSRRVVLFL